MKNKMILTVLFLSATFFAQGQIKCVIQGEIIDRPYSTSLMLTRYNEDMRVKRIDIPINENRFEYTLECSVEEGYVLMFEDEVRNGSWRSVLFFSENDTLRMVLHPEDEWQKNQITGGVLTQEYVEYLSRREETFNLEKFYEQWDEIMDDDKAYSEKMLHLRAALENATEDDREQIDIIYKEINRLYESGEQYSDLGKAWEQKHEDLIAEVKAWELKLIGENTSLCSYQILYDGISWSGEDAEPYFALYNAVYANKYPNHPYTKQIQTIILSDSNIKPGGKFIDFTAPDFNGQPVTLSTQIEGKVALIDLWASWCGPCRRHSTAMIPIYEQYKDRGFTVVGVARESKAEHGINAARQDGYPWVNLLEIKDAAGIWNLYGVGNGGGGTFLVDRDGTILAVQPEPEEVEKWLKEKLEE